MSGHPCLPIRIKDGLQTKTNVEEFYGCLGGVGSRNRRTEMEAQPLCEDRAPVVGGLRPKAYCRGIGLFDIGDEPLVRLDAVEIWVQRHTLFRRRSVI